ncbi:MAG: hypothetical protein HC944_02275 [Nanoarchaeota archaeon]|nr:hypothetical protein [Nanoarchaeota archaeon]
MNFDSELKKGNFIVAECTHCKKIVWPPSEFCNKCFREVSWRKGSHDGKIIEFSKQNNVYFCLVEIENSIRIIGKLSKGNPVVDQHIKIKKCGMIDGSYNFEISLM